nr:adenosine deaminase 2-like [Onthophagus taurus]
MLAKNQKMWSKCYQGVMITVLIGLTVTIFFVAGADVDDYWAKRDEFIKQEESRMVGNKIELNEIEKIVNGILMEYKWKEFDEGFENPKSFIPANHIFETLDRIEKSDVFQFIQKLPKGSMLHGHDTALVSGDFLYQLTYKPDLFACYVGANINLKFFKEPVTDSTCDWKPIASMRESDPNFDEDLKSQLTLITPDFRTKHTDINTVWSLFMDIFMLIDPLVCYKPVFEEYFYQVLQELYNDNVMYLEFRSTLPEVYDLDGNIYGSVEVAGIYKQTLDAFMESHPDFIGAKLIYAPVRKVDNDTMNNYIDIANELAEKYPTFLAGFDLVGQEDLGNPLIEFINQLLNKDMSFYFHAGETNWYGSSTDLNLVDAVLLGTKRIGHGYAVLKHPDVADKVKRDGIALEISPISNQVLMLISDLRNHPGNYLIANDYPVVITNDDPSFWGAKALSHDWYMAFMGMTSRNADLRFLKQIALNSIEYSSISDKNAAFAEWEKRWNHFLTTIIENKIRTFPKVFVH